MALRSIARKLPALGARSPPMGPRIGPVHALSPAAGSRLMSHGGSGTGGQVVYSDDDKTLAKQREEIKRMTAEFDQSMKDISKNLDDMDLAERRSKEDLANFHRRLDNMQKVVNVALIVLVPTSIMIFLSL
ncbi:hypothetical protein CFC21_005758 [Triticum aestivum]|uniref:Uncharacterized protein n=3 Tax=Triticum TaxID=4564 RepID=A0A9R1PCW3_TRITD|nr:uncharacterized protein LOC123040091 [Triticum aestivum]KAF6988186.1 hypothetical protein CFC21_005758 [Triticum aestivum]VAH40505.1 unnamed protein product [Triticum turgidum subsp. durum]